MFVATNLTKIFGLVVDRMYCVSWRLACIALSQAPRIYETEPKANLTQLFPYPEKIGGSLSTEPRPQEEQYPSSSLSRPEDAGNDTDSTIAPGNKSEDSNGTQPNDEALPQNQASEFDMDIDSFDVNLDTIPHSQAALLAEKMISMIYLVTLDETIIRPTAPIPEAPRPQIRLRQKQEDSQPDSRRVKQEQDDDNVRLTPTLQDQLNPVIPKQEPASTTADPGASADTCPPTQSPSSKETNVILCATFMSPSKKQQLEHAARILKARAIDDLVTRPTHIVMDLRINVSMSAGYWVDEVPYQIYDNEFDVNAPKKSRISQQRGEPPLFTGCEVQLFGIFNKPTKEEVELIIRTGGGTVVPQLFLRDTRFARSIASHHNSADTDVVDESTRHLILYDHTSEGVMSLKKLKTEVRSMKELAQSLGKTVRVVHCKNLFDSIAKYDMNQLVDTDPA
ncbi:BRCA1-associated RING domain protein 1 [Gamsiella multidivaricata]|nr:BRCA1-associated RING domain protein 1 [Gamsiella multidivaricata]